MGVSRRLRTKLGNTRTSDVSIKSRSWPPRGSHHAPDKRPTTRAPERPTTGRRYSADVAEETSRDDLTAAIGARRELGKEYEDAVVDSFVARLAPGSQSPRCLWRLPAPKDCSCPGPESRP